MDASATARTASRLTGPPHHITSREPQNRLHRSSYLALRDVSCEVSGSVVTLRGKLPSHYLKQIAQEYATDVAGVSHVVNLIQVLAPTSSGREKSPDTKTSE